MTPCSDLLVNNGSGSGCVSFAFLSLVEALHSDFQAIIER